MVPARDGSDPTAASAAAQMMGDPDQLGMSITELRRRMADALSFDSDIQLAEIIDLQIVGPACELPLRVYRPSKADELPVVVFFHGGGFVLGDIESHDAYCRALSSATGYVLVSVDYRLAPEAKYPEPVEDCYAATRWVYDHSFELRVDRDRLAVAGNSSGGCMAAAVVLMARDRGLPAIRCQVLVCPVLDARQSMPSYRENADGPGLTAKQMAWFWRQYLPEDEDRGSEPYASPLLADSLEDLPPTLVITAEGDPLRDEGEAYARRLRDAGVDAVASRFDGVDHGFPRRPIPQAERALVEVAATLKRRLG